MFCFHRRLDNDGRRHNLCSQKVLATADFLQVQVDTDYRRKWDNTAVMLEVAERDPVEDVNGDILYWEMQWPVCIITLF